MSVLDVYLVCKYLSLSFRQCFEPESSGWLFKVAGCRIKSSGMTTKNFMNRL